MRTLTFLFAFVIIFTGLKAQDLNEVLQSYFETIGQEKFIEHQTLMVKGKSIQQGMETDFTMFQMQPNRIRIEVDIQGTLMVQAFNGQKAWYTAPWTGTTDPIEMTGFQLQSMKRQADFDGMLYNYEEKGYTTELIGTEDMEGTQIYKIKQTDEEGNLFYHFIDAENYVLLKMNTTLNVDDSQVDSETLFSNYKEKDGMILPYSMETRMNGQTISQINMEEYIFDEKIDDSIFVMPEKEEPKEEPATEEKKDIEE